MRQLRAEVDAATAEKLKALMSVEEEKAAVARAAFAESRRVEERSALEEELGWVRKAQTEAEERLSRERSERRLEKAELSGRLNSTEEELVAANEAIADAQQREEELSAQLHALNDRIRAAADDKDKAAVQFQRELDLQAKLSAVYKESTTEAEAKIGQLTEALQSVSSSFEESKAGVLAMKEELERVRAQAHEDLKAAQDEAGTLKEELDKANELLRSKHRVMLTDEEVAELSPGAAAASKLIRDGRSLTNIYRDHSRIVEDLEAQRCENRRLEQYIKEIVNDIQEKAPALRAQKEDLQQVRDANKALQEQLIKAGAEHAAIASKADAALRELKYTQAELERYQRDNADLGSQVPSSPLPLSPFQLRILVDLRFAIFSHMRSAFEVGSTTSPWKRPRWTKTSSSTASTSSRLEREGMREEGVMGESGPG